MRSRVPFLFAVLTAVTTAVLTAGCNGGCGLKPQPQPVPVPVPPDPPQPPPTPAGVVIVEDPAAAGTARGAFFADKRVQGFFKNSGLQHAVVSVRAVGVDGQVPAAIKPYLDRAAGKLPHLFVVDAAGKTLREQPFTWDDVPAFVALFDSHRGQPRKLGLTLAPPKLKWPQFGTEDAPGTVVIPRAQWTEVDLEAYLPPVKDQDGVGACASFAAINGLEFGREVAGLSYKKLSPGYLYGHVNGQRDNGSLLEDNLAYLRDHGTCTADTVPELSWQRSRWPSSAAAEAKNYRVAEFLLCPTFDHVASAILQGFPVEVGVAWFDNFTPDRDGWLPEVGRGGSGGHAILAYGLAQRNGKWGVKIRNSWGPSFGIGGNCVIPEAHLSGPIGGFWAVQAPVRTPEPFPPAASLRRIKLDLRPDFTLAP